MHLTPFPLPGSLPASPGGSCLLSYKEVSSVSSLSTSIRSGHLLSTLDVYTDTVRVGVATHRACEFVFMLSSTKEMVPHLGRL